MGEHCADHDGNMKCISDLAKSMALLQKDIEYLRRDQEVILSRFSKHVEDAEKDGGRHERLAKAEADIKDIAKQRQQDIIMIRWFMIGSGFIGGMMGAGAPEAFLGIARAAGLIK